MRLPLRGICAYRAAGPSDVDAGLISSSAGRGHPHGNGQPTLAQGASAGGCSPALCRAPSQPNLTAASEPFPGHNHKKEKCWHCTGLRQPLPASSRISAGGRQLCFIVLTACSRATRWNNHRSRSKLCTSRQSCFTARVK